MNNWWRSWHGAPTDPKWLVVANEANVSPALVAATFWALCDYASQHEQRGSVDGFDVETYAFWSQVRIDQIEAVIAALTRKSVVANNRLANWEKRQPKREDDSTERVRAHRERSRQRNAQTQPEPSERDVTPCNAAKHEVTPEKKRRDKEESRACPTDTMPATAQVPAAAERDKPARVAEGQPNGKEQTGEAVPRENAPAHLRGVSPRAPAPLPAPGASTTASQVQPYDLYTVLCEELGAAPEAPPPPRQMGIAKRLAHRYTPDDVRGCLRFLSSQHWRNSPIDLATVEAQIEAWILNGRPEREQPPRQRAGAGMTPIQIAEYARALERSEQEEQRR